MSDKELLEFAAKAAGIVGKYTDFYTGDYYYQGETEGIETGGGVWNPLNDDGDALRLAVKLCLDVCVNAKFVTVRFWTCSKRCEVGSLKESNNDPLVATRRAIVRAAAEIGKTL